jgi:transcriptional regulator with XRE-family HTH domain
MTYTSELIKHSRLALDISQQELAKKVGCHFQQISQMERGAVGVPKALIKKLAKTLRIPIWQLRASMVKDYSRELQEITK